MFSILGTSGPEQQGLHPQKLQAIQLWQVFTQNVDPVAKVLHMPTAQVTVLTAIQNLDHSSDEVQSLLFAVYYAAVTSLSTEESAKILGQDSLTSLNRFRRGFEQALARANWLEHPTLTTLQAMALFLVSLSSSVILEECAHAPMHLLTTDSLYRRPTVPTTGVGPPGLSQASPSALHNPSASTGTDATSRP